MDLQTLQAQEKSFTDRLREQRARYAGAFDEAQALGAEGLSKASQGVNPLTILQQIQGFRESGLGPISTLEKNIQTNQDSQLSLQKLGLAERAQALDEAKAGVSFKLDPKTGQLTAISIDEGGNEADLLKLRKERVSQGLDTTDIDQKLSKLGIQIPDVSKEKQGVISLVDELLGRDTNAITGIKNPLKYLTGEAQYTSNMFKQLKATLSLDNISKLKGTGAISDKEGELLANSASALDTNLNNKDFQKELKKIRGVLSGTEMEATKTGALPKEDLDLINKYKNAK